MVSIRDVELARNGDKDAFVRITRTLEPSLYRIAATILKSDTDCADALQETIMKAYRGIHALKEPAHCKTWFIRILINVSRKMLQVNKKYTSSATLADELIVHEQGFQQLEIREAVEALNVDLRIIVHLYYYDDLPVRTIAELLELPEGTVKSRLSRARDLLYRQIQDSSEGGDDCDRSAY